MTITSTQNRVTYAGNGAPGVPGTLVFAVPFRFLAIGDLVVLVRVDATGVSTTMTLDTNYSVAGEGAAAGGTVTFLIEDGEPQTGETLIIYGSPAMTQLVDYISGGTFPAESHEEALDRLTLQSTRTREIAERALPLTDVSTDGSGQYNANSNRISSLGTPTATTDATTKTYVDALVNNTALGPAPTGLIATGSVTSRLLADRWGEIKNVKDYGATGDGVTNDTVAIQAAVNAAVSAGGSVVFPPGVYSVSTVTVATGLRVLDCTNGTLKAQAATGTSGVLSFTSVSGATISARIDMSVAGAQKAIHADGVSDCVFTRCHITGFTNHATLNHYGIHMTGECVRNTITQNYIAGYSNPTQRGLLLDMHGGGQTGYGGFFTGTIVRATSPAVDTVISDNVLIDGSYAVNILGCEKFTISGNVCRGQNHRSLYSANASWNNSITGNQFLGFASSAVVLGYGTGHTLVSDNVCKNEGVVGLNGEAAINITTGSSSNHIYGNLIDAPVNYGVYMGADISDTRVVGNNIRNQYQAGIALDNDLVTPRPTYAVYSRVNYGAPPVGSSWSFANSTGNVIAGNTIGDGYTGRNTAAIAVAQIDAGGSTSTTRTTIVGNTVTGTNNVSYNLFLYSDTDARLTDVVISGNVFHEGNTVASYNSAGVTTWASKVRYFQGDVVLSSALSGEVSTFADGDTTPSVSINSPVRTFGFANTAPTVVTNFDDGYSGQVIVIRGSVNTTIEYDTLKIRPKGLLDVDMGSSNYFISFMLVGTVWVELWRSFEVAMGTYTATNVSTDRAYDANATTTAELADVLGTLIADLRLQGIVT